MRSRVLVLVAGRELRGAVRSRWLLVGAIAFTVLAVAVSLVGMAGAERWGVSALDRTSAALLNVVILFVPLLALPLGASSVVGEAEDGTLGYLLAQPVHRSEILAGKLLGLVGAMTVSLGFGFGSAALIIALRAGGVAPGTFFALAGGAWLLAVVMVIFGAFISVVVADRTRALAAAIAVWVTLVFLGDIGVLAMAASKVLGPGSLFAIATANPLQAVKTLVALSISTRLEILGPAGTHAVHLLGRVGLASAIAVSLAVWASGAGLLAGFFFHRRNVA